MTSNIVIFLAGLVGLIGTIIKMAKDSKTKKEAPDAKYENDIKKFDQAIATGDDIDITVSFEQLHLESEKRNRNSGG
jgi:hypothetical protein